MRTRSEYKADYQYAAVLKPVIRTILESSDLSSMYVGFSLDS